MHNLTKLLLVVLIATSCVQGVSLLRREKGKQLPIQPGSKEAKHRFLILLQDAYDDYAEELAQDPYPQYYDKKESHKYKENQAPYFVPAGEEKKPEPPVSEVSDPDLLTKDQLEDIYVPPSPPVADQDFVAGPVLDIPIPDISQIDDPDLLTKDQLEDIYVPPSPPPADEDFVAGPVLELPPIHYDPPPIIEIAPENALDESSTHLSGSNLAEDSISDKLVGEHDFSDNSAGSGDYQSPNAAFEGDSDLTSTDIAESKIQSQENGLAQETDLEPEKPSSQGLEEEQNLLTGGDLTRRAVNEQAVEDLLEDKLGAGNVSQDESLDGDNTLSKQDIVENSVQSSVQGKPVETDFDTEETSEPGLEEEKSYLSGGKLTQQAVVEKQIEGEMDDNYGVNIPVDSSLDGDKTMDQKEVSETQIQQTEQGQTVETELDVQKPEEPELDEERSVLSGGTLTQGAIWEKLAEHKLKEDLGITVPQDDSLYGDSDLSRQDVQEQAVQSQQNGVQTETDFTPTTHVFSDMNSNDSNKSQTTVFTHVNDNGLSENETQLSGGDLTSSALSDDSEVEVEDSLGGDSSITKESLQADVPPHPTKNGLSEQQSLLSGGDLTQQAVEDNDSDSLLGEKVITKKTLKPELPPHPDSNGLEEQKQFLTGGDLTLQTVKNENEGDISSSLSGNPSLTSEDARQQFVFSSEGDQVSETQLKDKDENQEIVEVNSPLTGSEITSDAIDLMKSKESQFISKEQKYEEAIFN